MLQVANGDARLVVLPEHGGVLSSFALGDLELLRTPDDDAGGTHWGCFVMAPWAGRTRHGRFTFEGVDHQLACDAGPHAIHGTVRHQPWTVERVSSDSVALSCPFGPGWPFPGHVEHTIRVHPDHVAFELALHSEAGPMPAVGGWHPWWRRPVHVDLPARTMLRRDAEGITTEERVSPIPPGPWDDCFTDLTGPPVLRWPGGVELTIESDCGWVVVYDEPAESVCVEPQSGPPDALNHHPAVASPGHPVVIRSAWCWRP